MASPESAAGHHLDPPSLVQLAAGAIRDMILSGELGPGERLRELALTERLGISRPPLREALRLLQQEGLIVVQPRRGATVVTLTDRDVHEILTLRSGLERTAVELGVPVRDLRRLEPCRAALGRMEQAARARDRDTLRESGYAFHAAIVGLAGHRRIDEIYASLHRQLLLCVARDLHVRERHDEDLDAHVARHRQLLALVEAGDPEAVVAELAAHGERSFTRFARRAQ